MSKRQTEENGIGQSLVVKKTKYEQEQDGQKALIPGSSKVKQNLPQEVNRTSQLHAPIMLLTGHTGEVFSLDFNNDGQVLASGSMDKNIHLWKVYGDCENFAVLQGHKNAVLEAKFTHDGEKIVSVSPDKTVRVWDAEVGIQIKKLNEHTAYVNSCQVFRHNSPLFVSGADDNTVKIWDLRQKRSIFTFTDTYQVLSVEVSDSGEQVYSAGIENMIKIWDLRRNQISMALKGHLDSITGMSLNRAGTHLLTNSMDNTLRMWDMRPYAPQNRCVKIFNGHLHGFEKSLLRCGWSKDGSKIISGSSDQMVYVWDVQTRRILYRLPGHKGSVNTAIFHQEEPIIASGGSDSNIYLGEIQP